MNIYVIDVTMDVSKRAQDTSENCKRVADSAKARYKKGRKNQL